VTAERIAAAIELRRHALIELAQVLIATPSPNPPGHQGAVADVLTNALQDLGMTSVLRLHAEPDRPNLVAELDSGIAGRRLALNGHIDTKPPGERSCWRTDPFSPVVRDGKLYGLGAVDMKGSIAAMVHAAAALRDIDGWSGQLLLIFSADEEAPGFGANWLVEQQLVDVDAIVIGEPSGIEKDWEALHIVSRGAALFRVSVRGTQMHSSLSDRLPSVNATVMMARLIDRMHGALGKALWHPPHPLDLEITVNVGVMASAGVYYGVLPGRAEFCCDVRTVPGMTRDRFAADLDAFIAAARADEPALDCSVEIEGWFPATEIAATHPVVRALQSAAASVLGSSPPLQAFPASSDAVHFSARAGIPTVPSFGPGILAHAHNPNEFVSVEGIVQAAKIYAIAAHRYLTPA